MGSLLANGAIPYGTNLETPTINTSRPTATNWPVEDFYRHLGLGCYPLHPLTSYLLCNLEFTQGRTAIQFIKEDVTQFIAKQPVEENGELQFVRPVQLMDAFAGNFSLQSTYTEYEKAYESIAAFASADEINMLKAIALYYLCGEKSPNPNANTTTPYSLL